MRRNLKSNSGFTLIEIIVSLGIFAIVAVVAIGALMTASRLNRKAQATKLVVDNLNFALDSMTLKIRRGALYTCLAGADLSNPPAIPANLVPTGTVSGYDCSNPGDALAFRTGEVPSPGALPVYRVFIYRRGTNASGRGELQVALPNEDSTINPRPLLPFVPITVDALDIKDLSFYVFNSEIGSSGYTTGQPRVLLTLNGQAAILGDIIDLGLETTVSSRE